MPNFRLAQTVSGNVTALREALGSAVRPLSLADLAGMISGLHPGKRPLNSTTIRRWEEGESEPDIASLVIMARLAGVPLEQFVCATDYDGGTVHNGGKEAPSPLDKVRPAPIAAFVPVELPSQRKAREAAAKRGKASGPRRRQA